MPKVVRVKKGDSTLVGINKQYQTGTTAITSNPDNFSITHPGHSNASGHPNMHNLFSSNNQTEILNYPYAYDQDFQHEADF